MLTTMDNAPLKPTCKPTTSLAIPCLRCGETDAVIYLDINGMHDTCADVFKCGSCDAEYSIAEAKNAVEKWGKVLSWIDAAPVAE